MENKAYLEKISKDFAAAKAKALAMISPEKKAPEYQSSDYIPFPAQNYEPVITATNDNLINFKLKPTHTHKSLTPYANYPYLSVDTVIVDDELKIVLPRRPAFGQVCIIDWLNITMKAMTFQTAESANCTTVTTWQNAIIKNVSKTLENILGFGISHQANNGKNFYDQCYHLEHKAGQVCIGGQNDTVLIMLTGEGCTFAKYGWEEDLHAFLNLAIEPKITRIDLAHDDLYGDYTNLSWFARQFDLGGFSCGNRRPEIQMLGNWKYPNGKGRSLYIGTAKSSKYCRIYEKGMQLGNPASAWLRCEVEFKAKNIFIPLDVLINPSPFFLAAYPCFHIFDHQTKLNRDKFERIEQQNTISFASAVAITKNQFGRYLYCFRKEFAKHGLTDADVLDLLTDIENKKYPDRLNALSIPDFFKPKATH